jgi:hypothetical protein
MFLTAGGKFNISFTSRSAYMNILIVIRLFFKADDLLKHVEGLAKANRLPDLEQLIKHADILVDRYASQGAPQHALSAAEATDPDRQNKVPEGTPWIAPAQGGVVDDPSTAGVDEDMPDLAGIQDGPCEKPANDAPKVHQEKEGFDGDRVLRNSEIFMMEFGWWLRIYMKFD